MCSTLPDFSQGIDKKWQDHSYIHPMEECEERFNFVPYRIHRSRANHMPVC